MDIFMLKRCNYNIFLSECQHFLKNCYMSTNYLNVTKIKKSQKGLIEF